MIFVVCPALANWMLSVCMCDLFINYCRGISSIFTLYVCECFSFDLRQSVRNCDRKKDEKNPIQKKIHQILIVFVCVGFEFFPVELHISIKLIHFLLLSLLLILSKSEPANIYEE